MGIFGEWEFPKFSNFGKFFLVITYVNSMTYAINSHKWEISYFLLFEFVYPPVNGGLRLSDFLGNLYRLVPLGV